MTPAGAAARHGWAFVLNPAPAAPLPAELLSAVAVLTPNEHELAELAPGGARELLAAGAGAVLTTLGGDGAQLARQGQEPVHVPPARVRAVDTTGAGDTFSGALAVALAGGAALEAAARERLLQCGFRPDYVEVRRKADLARPRGGEAAHELAVLGAGWLGRARLIDNVLV